MNENFKDYVRSGAFSLTLSKQMIGVLLCLNKTGEPAGDLRLSPYTALLRRGLVSFGKGKGFTINEAGVLVAELLIKAGYEE